ncbi:lipoporotein NlpE [Flavobacteriaceae bacterium Ap0902]|nr:lipoporotein NlpE [Flavobacteriaceae bacterium Ap0902]
MKKVILTMMTAGLVLTSCEKKSDEVVTDMNDDAVVVEDDVDRTDTMLTDNSQTSLDWAGTYQGIVPCASCEGIDTEITLNEDGTYTKEEEYLGEEEETKFSENGSFVWNEEGTVVTLTPNDDAANNRMYKVEEGRILALDADGNVVEGELAENYVLIKQ